MFVESTMGISRWFMLTTIYHDLYQIKCWRVLEKQFHYPRGRPRWPSFKYSGGGLLLILLILIMWFPLAFMSIVQTVAGVTNVPKEATISLSLNGYETLYTSTVTQNDRIFFTEKEYKNLEMTFASDMGAQQYISRYEAQDIAKFKFTSTSRHLWMITSPQRQNLFWHLMQTESSKKHSVYLTLSYSFRRKPGEFEIAEGYLEKEMSDEERINLKEHIDYVIKYNGTQFNATLDEGVVIKTRFPQYVRALTTNDARPIGSLVKSDCYFDIKIKLSNDTTVEIGNTLYYWEMNTQASSKDGCAVFYTDKKEKNHTDIGNTFIVFSDRAGPESLAWLTGYGIIGLYLSVTLLCGR